jgi:hypothetical protein
MNGNDPRVQFLPKSADNNYRGHKVGLVLFGFVLLMRTAMNVGSIFNGYNTATTADGIPLDTYAAAGAETILALFGLNGLANLTLVLIGVVILVRYRSLVPLMFGILLLQHLSRYVLLQAMPIARTGAPPGTMINLIILGILILGLGLSLWPRRGVGV